MNILNKPYLTERKLHRILQRMNIPDRNFHQNLVDRISTIKETEKILTNLPKEYQSSLKLKELWRALGYSSLPLYILLNQLHLQKKSEEHILNIIHSKQFSPWTDYKAKEKRKSSIELSESEPDKNYWRLFHHEKEGPRKNVITFIINYITVDGISIKPSTDGKKNRSTRQVSG
jgi:hypothetical protein